jgi:hypothetical protein
MNGGGGGVMEKIKNLFKQNKRQDPEYQDSSELVRVSENKNHGVTGLSASK